MLEAWILALILQISPQEQVPPYLVAAIIIQESGGNVLAVGRNQNGTVDLGLMQLNSGWFDGDWRCAETNIRAGARHLRVMLELTSGPYPNWYGAVIAYNCGYQGYLDGPPMSSINYAVAVFELWNKLDPARRYLVQD